ncbi:DUF1801 domain-containing protein [Arachidicoccus soli]|uniref:YdhG-like domain-containing protein n=1 Tax=Arachidicoccus soli TaxID=2341117 RepID=A0A386HL52_9BACT|nr:DUF1801 domain-containing protein [Arachidicoccus soli]AYD46505.1 hypothetical protein D6B99_02060 [Arachidicoccus soli]
MKNNSFQNVDEYISSFTLAKQKILNKIRSIILEAAPDAQEMISYNMPAYKLNKILVYFGMAKNHLGFYPTASGIQNFENELNNYKTSKGAIQFPLDQPLPKELIQKIVAFRVNNDSSKTNSALNNGFLLQLSAPARRALENAGITKLADLKKFTEKELLQLHGLGKTSLPKLKAAMESAGLNFLKK